MNRVAIFSCSGLGDGIVALFLAHTLSLNGVKTTTFHKGKLFELQNWYPHLPISTPPPLITAPFLESFDLFLVFYDGNSSYVLDLIKEGKRLGKLLVLNASFSKKVGKQPYYADSLFDPALCMAENISLFCKRILNCKSSAQDSGITLPTSIVKEKRSVIIHPTAAKAAREWGKEKFLKLAKKLKKEHFNPIFIVSKSERKEWLEVEKEGFELPQFASLDSLANQVARGACMIGNDSGIGHLASALHLPCLIIFRGKRLAKLWRPGFFETKILYPSPLILNFRFLRLRDKFWQKFIFTSTVFRTFKSLASKLQTH